MLSINGIHEIAQKNFDSKVIHRHGRAVNIREVNISSQVYLSDELIMVDKTNNDNLNITLPDTNNPELIKGTLYEIKDGSMMCNVDSFITIKGFNVDDSIDGEEDYIIQSEGEAIKICYLGNKRWRII